MPDSILPARPEFVIQAIMPTREVHLLAGPSGSGKTTLAVQMIQNYLVGAPLWGRETFPRGLVYLSCDRSLASVSRALARHSLSPADFPVQIERTIPAAGNQTRLYSLLLWCQANHPGARFIVIDGFASLVPDSKIADYGTVAAFLKQAQFLCEQWDLTILGLVHATKVRETDRIPNPRQRILGSVAWAGYSDCVIVLDPEDPEDPKNQNRIVHVLPRDAAEFAVRYENQDGRLLEIQPQAERDLFGIMYVWLDTINATSTNEMAAFGMSVGISKPSVERWIRQALDSGRIVREGRGRYRRVPVS
jgi:RecA-family ATPase